MEKRLGLLEKGLADMKEKLIAISNRAGQLTCPPVCTISTGVSHAVCSAIRKPSTIVTSAIEGCAAPETCSGRLGGT